MRLVVEVRTGAYSVEVMILLYDFVALYEMPESYIVCPPPPYGSSYGCHFDQ